MATSGAKRASPPREVSLCSGVREGSGGRMLGAALKYGQSYLGMGVGWGRVGEGPQRPAGHRRRFRSGTE